MSREQPASTSSTRRTGFIPANCWQGEHSCLVGPFDERQQAKLYEHFVVNRNGVSTSPRSVLRLADGWYIAVPSRQGVAPERAAAQ